MPTVPKEIKELSRLSKEEWKEYTKTVWSIPNVSDKEHPAVFPVEIPKRLIKLFSFWGELVYDPFAGIGTTASAALDLSRRSLSVELSADYSSRIQEIVCDAPSEEHIVACGDSRSIGWVSDSSVDLIVTSPPYWNKIEYDGPKGGLGDVEGYRDFFRQIRPSFEECFRVLRPGRKLCVVTANVNQYTEHGLLTFPLSSDFTVLLREIGFVMVNELIWSKDRTGGRWGSWGAQRPIFGSYPYPPNFLFKNVHEYILIFAKPATKKKSSKKAASYDALMEL